ncbi:MAG TPA: hypothetical protein VOA64_11120 [Candidatus Dormibacteraeota bacterium]|nr:hypothetical protein [Candidatus Dormibacteraeota bacterium]
MPVFLTRLAMSQLDARGKYLQTLGEQTQSMPENSRQHNVDFFPGYPIADVLPQ